MAKKEKGGAKKCDTVAKKGETASDSGSRGKKGVKERTKGKGNWHGSSGGDDDLATELAALGLRIKDITGDGNCFFRALGDQLRGDEGVHAQLRQRIVSYMVEREEDFAPFVEDDESFAGYIARMKKDGVWAGYMEVVAASRCLEINLTIYQAGQPRWRVVNHPEDVAPMLHLSYHDGQHYNSVRCADDYGAGPPAPVVFRGDGTLAARRQRAAGVGIWDERDERHVATSTACTDMGVVRKALEEAKGDVEAAIERVIEMLAAAPPEVELESPGAAAADAGMGGTTTVATAAGAHTRAAGSSAPAVAAVVVTDAPEETETGVEFGTRTSGDAVGAATPAELSRTGTATDGCPGAVAGSREDPTSGGIGLGPSDGQQGGACASSKGTVSEPPEPPSSALAAGAGAAASGKADEGATDPRARAAASSGSADASGDAATAAGGRRSTVVRKTGASKGVKVDCNGPSNNKRCPCGSNRKYKACCGPAAAAAQRRRAAAGVEAAEAAGAAAAAAAESRATVLVAQVAALVI